MKKIICMVSVLTLVAVLFAGCQIPGLNQGNNVAINPNPTQPTAPTATIPTPTTPARVAMSAPDLADYVAERTVTVSVETAYGTSTGTGFFIDDAGTLVTCNHVIDGAQSVSIEMQDGAKYDMESIIDFNEMYDIAILKIKISGNKYLETCKDGIRTGEAVYAIGSSLGFLDGTFSDGIISNTSRKVGRIDCIQTTAAISGGNSGGPLVNEYGEVVGINAFSYTRGENLNLAVKIELIDTLSLDKNWSINQYREWFKKEVSRSYKFWDYTNEEFLESKVNTYQYVTGQECMASDYGWDVVNGKDSDTLIGGYHDSYGVYFYSYDASEFDAYTEYLYDIGFEFVESEEYNTGESYFYYNEFEGSMIDIFILDGESLIVIEPYYE